MNEHMPLPHHGAPYRLTSKLIVLATLGAVTWIATMFVWAVIQDREVRHTEASQEVSEQWSRPQTIAGPVITVPVEKTTITANGERVVNSTKLTLLPQDLTYGSEVNIEMLKRGVYETPVYTTIMKGSGSFDLSDVDLATPTGTRILWDQAVVSINVSDTRGITSMFDLTFNDTPYQMLPASEFSLLDTSGVHTRVALDQKQIKHQFSFELPLKGSRDISFLPLGKNTDVTITSLWNAPSFTGQFLPESRNITEAGFAATWKITPYGKNLPQWWLSDTFPMDADTLLTKAFGVSFYQEVDFYTLVNRSTKYSVLFISLTFLTFFMYEVLTSLRIHPMQYLLVGMAIALFYLLLLSFAEVLGFVSAYVISTTATVVLITGYCFSVLRAQKRAFYIALLLTALYAYLYILLQLDQYSLLFGSLLLFLVLATVMFLTRNLDWYTLNNK